MSAEQTKTEKPIVLLATQSRLSAKSMTRLLQAQFTVLEADDAETSWKILTDETTVNLFISDLSLLQDQFGLLERIKNAQSKTIRNLSLLLLIAEKHDDDDREQALNNGATDFITMPFSSSELIARVRMHTQQFIKLNQAIDASQDDSIDILQQLSPESFLESRLEQELSFSARHKIPVSVCKVEVNNLENIEKEHGHKAAHKITKAFAKVLKKIVRREDVLSYSGHGRFTILYPATNAIGALTALKRIKTNTDKTQVTVGEESKIIAFAGAIYTSLSSETIDVDIIQNELENRLDEALKKSDSEIITSGYKEDTSNNKPSIERALTLIEKDNADDLKKHSKSLMLQVIPLLRFSDQQLNLGMEKVIDSLIQRLKKR